MSATANGPTRIDNFGLLLNRIHDSAHRTVGCADGTLIGIIAYKLDSHEFCCSGYPGHVSSVIYFGSDYTGDHRAMPNRLVLSISCCEAITKIRPMHIVDNSISVIVLTRDSRIFP